MSANPGPTSSHSNTSIIQLEHGNNGKDRRPTIGWFSRLAQAVQLLPSIAFLAFQTLSSSFTNSAVGECYPSNRLLTFFLIIYLALVNLLFSFLDSFKLPGRDKTYFGIATRKGFHVLNMSSKRKKKMDVDFKNALDKAYKLCWIDWIHAFVSFAVFAALAISDADVVLCLLPDLAVRSRAFLNCLALALTSLAILVFFFFPSSRRGLGTYAANIHREERNVIVTGSQTSKHVDVDDKTQKNNVPSEGSGQKEPSTRMGMVMGMIASLDQLLPGNIIILYQALVPSSTNSGSSCHTANKCLTSSLIIFCAILCWFSSFTDTFKLDPDDDKGKLYFGIATFKGLFVINKSTKDTETKKKIKEISAHKEFKICATDWTHAVVSFALFGAFGISDRNVLNCFFPERGPNLTQLFTNLPFALALLASLIVFIFPTTRTEIGYAHASIANLLRKDSTATATPATDGNILGENTATATVEI